MQHFPSEALEPRQPIEVRVCSETQGQMEGTSRNNGRAQKRRKLCCHHQKNESNSVRNVQCRSRVQRRLETLATSAERDFSHPEAGPWTVELLRQRREESVHSESVSCVETAACSNTFPAVPSH